MPATIQIASLSPADVVPLVRRLVRSREEIPGVRATSKFVYAGTQQYEGRGRYADLVSEVFRIESPHADKPPALLFPAALLAVAKRLYADPSLFTSMRINKAVQKAMTDAGIGDGVIPSFYTNEAYYYALARTLLARM